MWMAKITHPPQGQWAFADSYMEAKAARLGLGLAYVPEELITDDSAQAHLSGCSSVIASVWKVHFSITRTAMCRPR